MCSLNLKSGTATLASIRTVTKQNNKPLIPILHENTVRFTGSQKGEIYFEITNHTGFDLTIDILNTNTEKINKIDLLRPFQTIEVERNEILGCAMVLDEYITDKGERLMFNNEKSRCFGLIKVGFDRTFGITSSWEIGNWEYPMMNSYGGTVVIDGRTRTETDGGLIFNTSRALLKPGCALEQVKFKETTTTEKFYASIKFDFGYLKTYLQDNK